MRSFAFAGSGDARMVSAHRCSGEKPNGPLQTLLATGSKSQSFHRRDDREVLASQHTLLRSDRLVAGLSVPISI
jgi:hypothetical protein